MLAPRKYDDGAVEVTGFDEFTEAGYRVILAAASARYAFEPYGTKTDDPHVLWRHDVDYSVHRALALARIEAEQGLRATYFFLLHSELYNLLEKEVYRRARQVLSLGHDLGVHFDAGFYDGFACEDDLAVKLAAEADLFESLFEQRVRVFSLHNTQVSNSAHFDSDEIAGLVNATGRGIKERYRYVSDSNGYWRFDPLLEVIESKRHTHLHVLTHPEWWQPQAMSPRSRIVRCIEGRSRFAGESYDRLLEISGRVNIR